MGRRRRRRVGSTDDWKQLDLLCAWEEQREYGRIKPLVLFGEPVPERAAETSTSEARCSSLRAPELRHAPILRMGGFLTSDQRRLVGRAERSSGERHADRQEHHRDHGGAERTRRAQVGTSGQRSCSLRRSLRAAHPWSTRHSRLTNTELVHTMQRPVLCIVAQGAKSMLLGQEVYEYDASRPMPMLLDHVTQPGFPQQRTPALY
jgi:hypothetical protein